jgi:nitroreductase
MELKQSLKDRHSCRRYSDKPVDAQMVRDLVTLAQRAPSWGNTQPWRIYAAGGDTARSIRDELVQAHKAGEPHRPDIEMPNAPAAFSGKMAERYRTLGITQFKALGIGREDREKRAQHYINNFNAFGAPALVFFTVPAGQTSYAALDGGAVVTAFCLAACDAGLGTVILAALARYPDLVRKYLPISADEKLLIGLALGYPDQSDHPANFFRSERADIDEVLTLTGF